MSAPFQEIELLGLLVNCLDLSVSLPEEKVASVVQLCEEACVEKISVREMAFILEKIAWATYAIVYPGSLQKPSTALYFPLERKRYGVFDYFV